ncbi:MAG: signal peptide peptidase SppA [Verrucomicrobiota bacterium]
MSNKRSGCLWVALAIVLGISLLMNLVLAGRGKAMAGGMGDRAERKPERLDERVVAGGSGSSRIALIPVRGIISSGVSGRMGESMVEDIRAQLRQASEDSKIKAIVLAVDSPGGEVTASDIIYNAVLRARERKPVVVSMGSLAASGGYYISCAGDYLLANETTFTGSIGVIIQTFRYNDLLGKIGVMPVTFKSGEFKDMLSGTREMTPAEKEYIQKLVMQTYGKFVGIVAKSRGLPEEQLRSGIADGRVITGKDALEAKLINAIGGIDEAYAKARELGKAPDASVVAYEAQFHLGKFFRLFGGEASQGKVEINLTQQLLPQLEPGKAYLLPSICVP